MIEATLIPVQTILYLAAVTSLLAWVAGHVQRVSEGEDPPAWIRLVEWPVYSAVTVFSVVLNLTLGMVFGPPSKDTLTLTKRIEEVMSHPGGYRHWQVTLAQALAWWVNKLWMGHIKTRRKS